MQPDKTRDKVGQAIGMLVRARHARGLYGEAHKLTREAIDTLYAALTDILKDAEDITIGIIGDEVAFEQEPFYDISKQARGFIGHLKQIKMEKISFRHGCERKELADFVGIISMKTKSFDEDENFEKILDSWGIRNIAVGKIGFKKEKETKELTEEELRTIAKKGYQESIDFLTKTAEDIVKNQKIDVQSARRLVSGIVSSLLKDKDLLLILTSTKSHDESTFVHDINVAIFTLLQAEALGLEQNFLNDIGVAALLHDVGKLSIPGDILRKKGKLTEDEEKKMRQHPLDGAKILLESAGTNILAAVCAFEHHISYDMEGYPGKHYGGKTNLISMIITIADYYDALRSRRHYRDEMAPEKTYADMAKLSGTHFHPDLLENFFNVLGVYPPGTLVELDTKEIGIVVKESALDMRRPYVEILYNKKGEKEKPRTINLLEKDPKGAYKWSIVKSIMPSDKFKISEKYL